MKNKFIILSIVLNLIYHYSFADSGPQEQFSESKKVFFIIGASGSGKTTVTAALDAAYPSIFKVIYFDSSGVPSVEEMRRKYNGPEEWQKINTFRWVKFIKERFLTQTNVILDGQIKPEFIEKACLENNISTYEVILFDCTDEERKKRLIARGDPELVNEQMINWAKYLRQESQKRSYRIIDNTNLTQEETLFQLLEWIDEHLEF
jgi:dephospho-CoA kinase